MGSSRIHSTVRFRWVMNLRGGDGEQQQVVSTRSESDGRDRPEQQVALGGLGPGVHNLLLFTIASP